MQMCPSCSRDNLEAAANCAYCGQGLRKLLGSGMILNNRYRVVKVLGCGGMGAVYLGEDTKFNNRMVAVKENLDTSPASQQQFMTEANILASLTHPHLPRVFDMFVGLTGRQYLVMDFVEGEDLEDIVEKQGPLEEEAALRWMLQIFDAVDYLHRQNPPVIHRDIKPANIKIRSDDTAVLVDFGISKYYRAGQETMAGAEAVTPGFSPPEQYGRGITDPRSDIYSLSATIYFALTGLAPTDAIERITKSDKLVPISSINPDVSPEIEQAILKALRLKPHERYSSVKLFRDALMLWQVGGAGARGSYHYPYSGSGRRRHGASSKRRIPPPPSYPPPPPPPPPPPLPRPRRRSRSPTFEWEGTSGCVYGCLELLFLGFFLYWFFFKGCGGCFFFLLSFLGLTAGWTAFLWTHLSLMKALLLIPVPMVVPLLLLLLMVLQHFIKQRCSPCSLRLSGKDFFG